MNYDELLKLLDGMPYLNPRLEKRITVAGEVKSSILLTDFNDLKLVVIDEAFTNADTKDSMLYIIKEEIEDTITVLKDILGWLDKNK